MTALAAAQPLPKLLIADDDPAIVKFLSSRCEKMGFQIDTATNGMQLLLKARQSQPDVLIVDVNMPELDGVSASARLLDTTSKPMNVIVVTGGSNTEAMERCESMGMYYSRKGPGFWKAVEQALADLYPQATRNRPDKDRPADESEVPQRPRVLIVDDDPSVGTFLASRLGKYGIDTLHASDAAQAIRIAAKQLPSAIISDYDMPRGDAQFLLSRLRSTPGTEKIPVIVLSGKNIDEQTAQNLQREILNHAGAARVVKKSYDVRELFGALEKFCAFEKNTRA
ncbi:MAG: response regulator [Pseudolabrys sp.]|nr:response regulator [Pseudolabrys sp.]